MSNSLASITKGGKDVKCVGFALERRKALQVHRLAIEYGPVLVKLPYLYFQATHSGFKLTSAALGARTTALTKEAGWSPTSDKATGTVSP